jgi:DNA-binding CsgD family transcriptional regulator
VFRSVFSRSDVVSMFRLIDRLSDSSRPGSKIQLLLHGVAAIVRADHAEISAWDRREPNATTCLVRAVFDPQKLHLPVATIRASDEPLPGSGGDEDVRTWTVDGGPGWGGPGLLSVRASSARPMTLLALRRLPGRRAFSSREAGLIDALNRCNRFSEVVPDPPAVSCHLPLSQRMTEVLEHLLRGHSEKEVASSLLISRHTVHVYVKSIYREFRVSSRSELLSLWIQAQLRQRPGLTRNEKSARSVTKAHSEPSSIA